MKLGTLRIKLPDGQTREYTVEQATLGIGRAADNELALDEISISRRHARFSFESGRMSVEDLGSANGTYIGSQRLAPNTPTLVPENETVRAGDVEVRFTPVEAPRPPAGARTVLESPAEGGAAMRYGVLHIRLPSGETRDFPMEQPSITVGRAGDNQLSLDEISVSRRHARLTVESSRLMIEDLGSANGTFIGTQRVAPNSPGLVPADQIVRIGDVEVRYEPPRAVEAARAFAQTNMENSLPPQGQGAADGPPVNVALVGPAGPVAPGNVVTATVTIQNRGSVVDEFVVRVTGVPGNWLRLSKERVPLLPNAQEGVTITFQPPRRAEAVATDHRFTVSVISREHQTGVNVQGTLRVLPYQGFVLSLQPVRSTLAFTVVAQNQGNAPVTYQLSGVDDERSLNYRFSQGLVTLQAGETANIPLEVSPKVRPSIGTRETRGFNILGTSTDQSGAAEVRAPGQLIIRPPIPIWLIPLVLLLLLCCCIGSAYAYFTFCPTYAPGLPFCPASAKPTFNVFTATPEEVQKGGAVVIAWDVSNAEEVSLISPVQNSLPPSGLQTFNLDATTTFTIRATNFAGSVDQSVTVQVQQPPPVIQSFTVTPQLITAGQTDKIVLSWTVVGATSVSIEGVPGQNLEAAGSVEIDAPTVNTTYNLVAANESGTVQQTASVVIASAECTVANVPAGDVLYLREGPGPFYALVVELNNGAVVVPFGRNPTGDWLKVIARDASREGWVGSNFISCTNAPDISEYPTVQPELIPTLQASATPTASPTTPPTGTPQPTNTPTSTPTATPTATPVFVSGGLVTYRVQEGGRTSIYLQGPNGGRIPLVFDKDDAEVLDFTPQNGGRFAIWVLEGGQQKVFIIDQGGNLVGGPITGGWTSVTDGDWSNDGNTLVLEVLTGAVVNYIYYDSAGNVKGAPVFP